MSAGLYDSVLKGQGHQGIFFFVKGTLQGNCKFIPGVQGHQGNDQGAWRKLLPTFVRCLHEVSSRPVSSVSLYVCTCTVLYLLILAIKTMALKKRCCSVCMVETEFLINDIFEWLTLMPLICVVNPSA